jgi:hypothetical protein
MARSESDLGLETIELPRAEEVESCQMECPCPEKLSAPDPVRFEASTEATCESAGGNPITEVCGRAASPCNTNMVELPADDPPREFPAKDGVWTTALEEPELETGADDVAGCEVETGAERGAECDELGAECELPPPQ